MTVVLDRALHAADAGVMADGKADPDPEVPERARRRRFTAKYKLEILAAYNAAEPGEKGAILRRADLYSSTP
jgi:transposase